MKRNEILRKINEALSNPEKGHNSMGASEAYYNAYYMIGKCFSTEKLKLMSVSNLKSLIELADFAAEVFY